MMIVAELTKNWRGGEAISGDVRTIGQLFEACLAHNAERGYSLHSWRFSQFTTVDDRGDVLTETVVAVFQLA